MIRRKRIFRRLVALLMLVLTVTSCVFSACEGVSAATTSSANSRVSAFIKLAAGQTMINDENLINNLTTEDLRFLGVYLSNFYVPFVTELGSSDSDATAKTKEDMTKALQTNLNFSESIASYLVEQIMGLARGNNRELEFWVSQGSPDDKDKEYTKVDIPVNYLNFVRLMLGQTEAVFSGFYTVTIDGHGTDYADFKEECLIGSNESNDTIRFICMQTNFNSSAKILEKKFEGNSENSGVGFSGDAYDYGYFGYSEGGEFTPVFDCALAQDGNGTLLSITPSMYAFYQSLGSMDLKNGYGLSIFDFNESEVSGKSSLANKLANISAEDLYSMSILGDTVVVDCFGDIIQKGGNHKYVVIPGCLNPYTWVSVDSSGNDKYSAGACYQVINLISLGMADNGTLTAMNEQSIQGYSVTMGKVGDLHSINLGVESFYKAIGQNKGEGLINSVDFLEGVSYSDRYYSVRLFRGSNAYDVGASWWDSIWSNSNKKVADIINDTVKMANSKDGTSYNVYVSPRFKLSGKFSLPSIRAVKLIDKMVYIDNLGAFGFLTDDTSIDYNMIQYINYFDDNGSVTKPVVNSWSTSSWGSVFSSIKDSYGSMNTSLINNSSQESIVCIYTAYALAGLYLNTNESKTATIGNLGYRMNKEGLVPIESQAIDLGSHMALDEELNTQIRNWVYYLFHPQEGGPYFSTLITNKINSFLVSVHHSMLGTNGVGNTVGTTYYNNNIGYVTTPDLTEMSWSSTLIDVYYSCIPYLILGMFVIMVLAYILGVFGIQRALFSTLAFSIFLFVPVTAISSVVGVSNNVSQKVYGEKFTYWALVQQESYSDALYEAANSGEKGYENYLKTIYANNNEVYGNQGTNSITLRWQAPKKMASLMLSEEDSGVLDNLSNSSLLQAVLSKSFSGESYTDGESQYMYRSYIDIANFSRYIYNGINQNVVTSSTDLKYKNTDGSSSFSDSVVSNIGDANVSYGASAIDGYINISSKDNSATNNYSIKNNIRLSVPLSSSIYYDAVTNGLKNLEKLNYKSSNGSVAYNENNFVGINQDLFNFSVAMFNSSKEDFYVNIPNNSASGNKENVTKILEKYKEEKDLVGLAAYGLMSESPFYYFSWGLYDMGMGASAQSSMGYKRLLLQDGGSFFYNKGNGELKDFMDLQHLFEVIIPYLKEGNTLVHEYEKLYGLEIYDDVPTEEGHWEDTGIHDNEEMLAKYWHNLNVARLYEVYTPWVDLMYDCSYAKGENIKCLGKDYYVADPLNPSSYPADRPMVFSHAQMTDYGLGESDLTKVERLILQCQMGMQERMYELLNYYSFSDFTLNTAAAINCCFEFNTVFSEVDVLGENILLYPQSFEIADCSFDAYLRLILANSIGENIIVSTNSNSDFYMNVVKHSGIVTAILMVVVDFVSVYVIPALRLAFLALLFISSIVIVLMMAFKIEMKKKFIVSLIQSLGIPMLGYFVATTLFSCLIALFMGTGYKGVTQSKSVTLELGSPVLTLLVLLLFSVALIAVYGYIVKFMFKDVKSNTMAIGGFISGVVSGTASGISGAVNNLKGNSSGGSGSSSGGSNSTEGVGKRSVRALKRSQQDSNKEVVVDKPNMKEILEESRGRKTATVNKKEEIKNTKKEKALNDKVRSGSENLSKSSEVSSSNTATEGGREVKDKEG